FDRLDLLPGDQRITALGLALDRKLDRDFRGKLAGNPEKLGGFALFEFQFHFAERYGLPPRLYAAFVDRKLDLAAVPLDGIDGALHPGFEYRLESAAQLFAQQRLERGIARCIEVGLRAGNFAFPFVASEQGAVLRRPVRDGLPAP